MSVFRMLKRFRAFEERQLPFLKTPEDFAIVREIGYYHEMGKALSPNGLTLSGLGSTATIHRRLRRLVKLGVVIETISRADRRVRTLALSGKIMRSYSQFELLVLACSLGIKRPNNFRAGHRLAPWDAANAFSAHESATGRRAPRR
jgi:DNA-binding MarR family transcriptional regulator